MQTRAAALVPFAAVLTLLVCGVAGPDAGQSTSPRFGSNEQIRAMLAERVSALAGGEDGIGIVVALVAPGDTRVVSYGHRKRGDDRPLDGDTLFEIGSVGKLFTALLLSEMVQKQDVSLDDPVTKHLPPGTRVPGGTGRAITLLDLATHTSGLPFMPDDVPVVEESAARTYGAQELYRFLARCRLTREPGTRWDYSNIGYWLLGQALASRAGLDFQTLLQRRVVTALGLRRTTFPLPLPPALQADLAVGHNAVLQPARSFYSTSIYAAVGPEAGGLVSTAKDLARFLAIAMGLEPSPLAPSMAAMLAVRRPIDGTEQALGWVVEGKGDRQLVLHEGGTWGYASCVAWAPAERRGVVVLSNQLTGVADIVRHLLNPHAPLDRLVAVKPSEVPVNPKVLATYLGLYRAPEEGDFWIIQDGGGIAVQLPVAWGLPKLGLRPESRSQFFAPDLPVRIVFETDAEGRANRILVYPPRGQRPIAASRTGPGR